jgi:hypothetical protein
VLTQKERLATQLVDHFQARGQDTTVDRDRSHERTR